MQNSNFGRTNIRDWRLRRGLSLRKLAALTAVTATAPPLISHASLGRIERGEQPYSQPILEAISRALDVSVVLLLDSSPQQDPEILELVEDFKRLDDDQRKQVISFTKFLLLSS
ncbi:MAG: helix-turn-helix transcriptional regulator [Bosea sp.]|nr:helix-turn-helix transcriptional regulator [Bosea sp. (in: a-proteobacteria)]